MSDVKQPPLSRKPKPSRKTFAPRHRVRRPTTPWPEAEAHRPEPDRVPYVADAPLSYARLRAYATRKPTLSAKLAGLFTGPIKKQLKESGIKRRKQDQLECLLRRMLSFCIRARSYGYFYSDLMLNLLLAEEKKRSDGYTKRQLEDAFTWLSDCGLIVFQLDAMLNGGLYRIAFYDAANLHKQEWHVANFAKTLKKNLSISHTCLKMKSHSYRAKALGILANKEEELAGENIKRHQARDRERRRCAEVRRRRARTPSTSVAQKPIAAPSRPVLVLTQATPPVSIQKLVTAAVRPVRSKGRASDRLGGALGQYREKLKAMGLTRAVQEYDRIQAARDLR